MSELFKALLLGAIQGITEFLPISSTGHLILAEKLLGVSQTTFGLTFDAALHLGTLVAILWYFKKEWYRLFRSLIRIPEGELSDRKNIELLKLMLIGTVPAVILGLLFEDTVDTLFRSPQIVAISLIFFSGVLYYVEKIGKKLKDISMLNLFDGLVIGCAQAVALIPGVSRSGITIAAGMWRNLNREDSARFAFLLSAPIVAGAGGVKLLKTLSLFRSGGITNTDLSFFAVGMISAGIFGYFTIKYFLNFLARHTLHIFIVYRVILGILVLGMYYWLS